MDDLPKVKDEVQEIQDNQLQCLNCGTVLAGRFCSSCGQDGWPLQKSVRKIFRQFVASLFDLDGKILQSIIPLVIYPGKPTLEFLEGKRRSRLNPFQMYAFFSFVFFFLSFNLPDQPNNQSFGKVRVENKAENPNSISEIFLLEIRKSLDKNGFQLKKHKLKIKYDSIQNSKPIEQRDNWLIRKFAYHLSDKIEQLYDSEISEISKEIDDRFISSYPNLVLLILPLIAFFLKVLYFRSPAFYLDHLIFSIHLYCNFFIISCLVSVISYLIGLYNLTYMEKFNEWFLLPYGLYFLVFQFIAFKAVYKQSWKKTTLKFFLGFLPFTFLLIIVGFLIDLILMALI
jgi:hypothetical protein